MKSQLRIRFTRAYTPVNTIVGAVKAKHITICVASRIGLKGNVAYQNRIDRERPTSYLNQMQEEMACTFP